MPPTANPGLAAIVEALIFASPEPITTAGIVRAIRSAAASPARPPSEAEPADDGDQAASEPELDSDEEAAAEPLNESAEWSRSSAGESGGAEHSDGAADARSVTESNVLAAIHLLIAHYEETGRAFTLEERASGWRIFTRPEFGAWVRAIFPERRPQRLSQPALETLAIIAYRQPITRAAIEAVRGVTIDGPLQRLLDMNIIRIAGRADLPGRPLLYETTDLFFEHFGVKSIDDLPNAAELRRIALPQPEEARVSEPSVDQPELPIDAAPVGTGEASEPGPGGEFRLS
jgi:segregation and condensation protein B